jgi:regulatory protein
MSRHFPAAPPSHGIRAPAQSAHARALDALARRARSAAELRRWLAQRGYAAAEVAETIARLTASGLLDDAKYSSAFATTAIVDRGLSRRRVLAELARRGVPRNVADAAVDAVVLDHDVDEDAAALAVATRKWRTLASLDPVTAQRRLLAFLARRGYDLDAARRVVDRLTGRQTRPT